MLIILNRTNKLHINVFQNSPTTPILKHTKQQLVVIIAIPEDYLRA